MYSLLNKNDVLIFDKSQKLTQLIKHYCGTNVQVLFCHNVNDLVFIDLNTVSIIYFCLEIFSDCKIVIELQKHVKNVFVITDLDLQDCFSSFSNISFIDNQSYPNNVIYDIYQKSIEVNNF